MKAKVKTVPTVLFETTVDSDGRYVANLLPHQGNFREKLRLQMGCLPEAMVHL